MKTRKITRYYCDHCHRGKFKIDAMEAHEHVCFHNPHRDCCECDATNTNVSENVKFLDHHELEELKKEVDDCPACTMAAVIQHNKNHDAESPVMYDTYKSERDEYRNEKWKEETAHVGFGGGD